MSDMVLSRGEVALNKEIGRRIRETRKAKGISQEVLAERADVSLSCMSRLESGKMMVSVSRLIRIAGALNVGVDEFLQDFIFCGVVEEPILNRVSYLLSQCSMEEQIYWVKNLQMFVNYIKKEKITELIDKNNVE